MLIRSKAPLRLGLAGGGTDVAPYSEIYGGSILNATISMYAYATIEPRHDGKIILNSIDKKERYQFMGADQLDINGDLDLLKGIYNRVVRDFTKNLCHLNLRLMWMRLRVPDWEPHQLSL